MNSIKVLFLAYDTVNRGSRDNITYNFIEKEMRALVQKGIEVHFLSRNLSTDTEKECLTIDGVHYHALNNCLPKTNLKRYQSIFRTILLNPGYFLELTALNPKRAWSTATIETAIRELSTKLEIAIIHSHFMWPSGTSGTLTAKHLNIPVISTLRGAELADMPEIEYGSMRDQFYRKSAERSLNKVQHFTTPSRYLAKLLQTEYKVPPEKIEFLPNGVEKISLTKSKTPASRDELCIIAVGGLIKRKNYDILISAIGECERSIRLNLVGTGPEESNLRRKVKSLNLDNKVTLHSEMSKPELYKMMSESDCFVHPALWEGLPNVVLESLAIGVPCLTSDIPVHQDLIVENTNGWLFAPHDCKQLKTKLEQVFDNREKLNSMLTSCKESVSSLNLDTKINGYLKLYSKLSD